MAIDKITSSGINGGLVTEIDQWFMPTSMTSLSGSTTLTNWSRPSSNLFVTTKGTGLSQSSGVFSFPSTGYYEIYVQIYVYGATSSGGISGQIYTTLNNSTYTNTYTIANSTNLTGLGLRHTFGLKITDTTNQKFYVEAAAAGTYNISGASNRDDTSMLIKKIGEL